MHVIFSSAPTTMSVSHRPPFFGRPALLLLTPCLLEVAAHAARPDPLDLRSHGKQPMEVPDAALLLGADVADLTRQCAAPLAPHEPIRRPLRRLEQTRRPRLRRVVPHLAVGVLDEPRVLGAGLTRLTGHESDLVAPRKQVLPQRGQREQRDSAAVVGDVRAELPLEREPPTSRRRPLPPTRHRPPAAPMRPSVVACQPPVLAFQEISESTQ